MTFDICKIKDVKTPVMGTSGSAGIDFFVPNDFKVVDLAPGEDINIPSGIRAIVPRGLALIAFNKSGVSTIQKFQVGACVVDSDYTGEIHLHVFNYGENMQTIIPGQKLVQFIFLPYVMPKTIKLLDKMPEIETERGNG